MATKIFVSEDQENASAAIPASKRIHVVTLTPFYPFAGDDAAGCFVAEPLAHLAPHNISSSVFAARPVYRARRRPSSNALPAKWLSFPSLPGSRGLPSSGTLLKWRLLRHLRDLHRHDQIDLIHAHSALPCGHAALLLARELNLPFVVSVHGLDAFSTRQVEGKAGDRCHRISDEVYRAARCVICVSDHVREQVLRGVSGPVNAMVVYNGVDTELFRPGPSPNESAPPKLLSVGDLIPTKGHALVLRALAAIRNQFPQVQYDIIGDGPELLSLQKLAVELKIKASFLGRRGRREVAEALRNCTVFALPSRYEGLGCAYLEAMASGRPAIGCRGQGIDEIIRHQENGWLVDGASVDEMASALLCLLGSAEGREKIGRAARRTIMNAVTLSHQAERLNHVYRDALA